MELLKKMKDEAIKRGWYKDNIGKNLLEEVNEFLKSEAKAEIKTVKPKKKGTKK